MTIAARVNPLAHMYPWGYVADNVLLQPCGGSDMPEVVITEPAIAAGNGTRHYARAANGDSILYPGVNTCVTVTLVFGDGTLVGTHFGMLKASEDEFAAIPFSLIYSTFGMMGPLGPQNARPVSALVIGNIQTWDANGEFLTSRHNLTTIRTTLRGLLGRPLRDTEEVDTNVVDGEQVDTVDIRVQPNGTYTVTPRQAPAH